METTKENFINLQIFAKLLLTKKENKRRRIMGFLILGSFILHFYYMFKDTKAT